MSECMKWSTKDVPVKVAVRQLPVPHLKNSDNIVKYSESANVIFIDDRPYYFDHVLRPEVSQKDLFDDLIEPLVEKVKKGFNCTALAYGQTGTGKSYTMGLCAEVDDPNESGVVRRCLMKLLEDIRKYKINVSLIEVYNEKAYDLLNANTVIMAKGLKYCGGVRKGIHSIDDCNVILKSGIKKRHVRPTNMNSQSSRSHMIFSIELVNKCYENTVRAYLNLVDLAGSEGVRRTGHVGVAKSEGVSINQGLLCISKMMQAMSDRHKIIPYRDSVLGSVLQDSLNSNSYLTLLACISPKRVDLSETLSTIRFAQQAKQVKKTPLMNSLLEEFNKTKAKTSLSTLKISRNPHLRKRFGSSAAKENVNNAGHLYNTFCTPSKIRRTAPKLNHTEIGLTPKEKGKAQKTLRAASTTIKSQVPVNNIERNISQSTAPRDSLFEHTVESWNLSTSSSATVETVSKINNSIRLTPIVLQCMEKFETIWENKMRDLIDNIQEKNSRTVTSNLKTPSPPKARCKLFTTSSPVFKVPQVPRLKETDNNSQKSASSVKNSDIMDLTTLDESVIQRTVRSTRRSSRLLQNSLTDNTLINTSANMEFQSLIERVPELRRSIRIATRLEKSIQKTSSKTKDLSNKSRVTSDFNESSSTTSSKNHKLKQHRKAILELLNNGSRKDLQVLPLIGAKTAYQLITHRVFNGKFKTMAEVEKLPVWRGQAWERFAVANMLI